MNEGLARGGIFLLIGSGTFSTEALDVLYGLRWMLILIVVLIVADFWYGLSESLQKKEHFRFSKAARSMSFVMASLRWLQVLLLTAQAIICMPIRQCLATSARL